jgi:hypothetical protein
MNSRRFTRSPRRRARAASAAVEAECSLLLPHHLQAPAPTESPFSCFTQAGCIPNLFPANLRLHPSTFRSEKTKTKRGGRRKLYTNRILLPLAPGVLERIDLMLERTAKLGLTSFAP